MSQLLHSQSKNSPKELMSYFNDVLKESGVSLKNDEQPNVISQEQALVTRSIQKIIENHITYPNNVKEFMQGLKTLCKSRRYFQKALTSTSLQKTEDVTSENNPVQQESLVRLLLNVHCLQNDIIEMLLEEATTSAAQDSEDTSWLRLLLNALRYLPHINDTNLLVTKLLDILEIATYPAQLEILNLVPDIIPDNECEQTARQLSKLLEENSELIRAITDCLNSLSLSSELRSEIQSQILPKFESVSTAQAFVILFEFLTTDCQGKNLQAVLMSARNAMDMIMSEDSPDKSNKVLIFNRMQPFTTAKKTIQESWLALFSSIQNSNDHKPIDLLILFMVHSIGGPRKNQVESFIRKRIKGGYFKIQLLESLLQKYLVPQIFKDYLNSMLEIARSTFKFSHDQPLVEFASSIYKMLFSHQVADQVQRQKIIENLILHIGTSEKKSTISALNVLISMKSDLSKLQQHTVQLMNLLEKLDRVDLKGIELIFDVLCSLTCGENADQSMSGFKDEIHMIIRKQLSSAKKGIKHRGIVGAVVMAKVLGTTVEEQISISVDDSISIQDFTRNDSQQAAALLELANRCTLNTPESVGLYYDQLALMLLTCDNLDSYLIGWLYTTITNDFQKIFVVESIPHHIHEIPVTMQFSLNDEEETSTPIAINIGELALKKIQTSILTLSPMLRLLRLLHYKQHKGDLGTIDALLGCAVVLPNLDDIDSYDFEQLKLVSNCLFHCINWFREAISAFVTQKSRKIRSKVLQRIADTACLEELLQRCWKNIPDYKLPASYFDCSQVVSVTSPVKSKPPRKKQKVEKPNETTVSTSVLQTQVTQPAKTASAVKKKTKESRKECIDFREIDTNVSILLRYSLKLTESDVLNASTTSQPTQQQFLNERQLNFLLNYFNFKLDVLTKNKTGHHLSVVNIEDFMRDSARLLRSVKTHLNVIVSNLEKTITEADGCMDAAVMFTPEIKDLKLSFTLIMNCFALIFNWPDFQHPKNMNLLKESLLSLTNEQQSQIVSVKGLIAEFTAKLITYTECCLYLPAAVHLVECMQGLFLINSNPEIKKKLAIVSGKLLTKKWYNLNGEEEVGKNSQINIDILVKAYLKGATVKTVCGLVATVQTQITDLKTKDDSLRMLASITKANFYILYRGLCVTLLHGVQNEVTGLTNNQHLFLWRTTALTMQGLMTIVKAEETKANLTSFLKNCIGILKVFLSNGIPIFEIMLRSKTDEVLEIFKLIQGSTRFLHHLCCYSKFTKDTGLVAYVPQFRLTLESLLYRVKAALVANNCSAAFWMGTLKNRDLHGQDILSQSTVMTEETDEIPESENELPSDDDEEEKEVPMEETRNNSDEDSSRSGIFD